MDHLEGLNPEQKEAATSTEGPLLIVAGAGAGKTKTLTHRILHLILEKKVQPEQILAVTFTNKAAKEMRERVGALLAKERGGSEKVWPGKAGLPFIATFHSLGVFMIRENAERLGLPKQFTIFDQNDSMKALKSAVKNEGFDPKVLEPKAVKGMISKQKNAMRSISDYEEYGEKHPNKANILRVWRRYEKTLKDQNALDFDDLLLKTARLLREYENVREKYQNFFKYVHIDEYQDTNKIQYEITKMLAAKHQNICVVGDADQNIYSWRGADIANILNFEKDYPGAKVVLLEENYRSTDIILKAANEVISKNSERIEKKLYTQKEGGEKIDLFSGYNEYEEASHIAEKIETLSENGVNLSDIAILYRANFQSRVLEDALFSRGIPYQMLGTKFFERKEVKDILSYLRAALNPKSMPDISRIVNAPPRGIGKVTLDKIENGEYEKMTASVRSKIEKLFDELEKIAESTQKNPPSAVILEILKTTGLEETLKNDDRHQEENQTKLENLYELSTLAQKYDEYQEGEGIEKLLEDASLMSDQDNMKNEEEGGGGVRLMTVHAAKGLEFPYVFITGLEDELFPHKRFGEKTSAQDLEEERRLFYVALTRAEKKLFLSHTSVRTKFGSKIINMPSEFLVDIKDEWLEEGGGESREPREFIFFD